ncbi:carbohydrate kinase family protein [soil metagenome]|nr:carbohydrate kinase family protein [Trueperaceae bacterium]
MAKLFVVGDATVDQMYFVDALPEPGGEVTALRALMEPGGAGGTMATALARLGHDVRIATRVGTGPFSELALRNVRDAGVDTSLIQTDDTYQTSSVTILITPDTQRTMISAAGASRYLDSAKLDIGHVRERDALVMSAYSLVGGPQREYAVQALAFAAEVGATTFVDMGSGAVNALQGRLLPLLRGVDYVLMNEKELFTLTGETSISDAVSGLRAQGIDQVVVKVGEMGSIVVTPNLTELVDAMEIDGVVDSTGAGDYYTAAFAHAVLDGYDLLEAAWRGNVAGALNTTRVGAQRVAIDVATLERHAGGIDVGAA